MSQLYLVWKNVWRKKLRTLFTLGAIAVAFVLFGLLAAIKVAFSAGVDVTGLDRLVTIHKVSLIQPLPISYQSRIQSVPGVEDVAHATWFGGYYQEEKNFFPQFPVDPESYMRMFPELVLPAEQMEAWLADRTGAVVGRNLADQYGFEIGDRIPIQATIWTKADGSRAWEFNIVGIYDGAEKGTDTTLMLFHYDYFNEARAFGQDLVGWYTVRIADPDRAPEIAEAIDRRFANSPAETKTTTEKAFAQGFANQIGNIAAIVRAIVGAVFFILLLVAGNTMAQSVRERISELAVLKTLGFKDGRVLALVLAESFLLALSGGALGLALAWLVVGAVGQSGVVASYLPVFYLPAGDLLVGAGLALVLGLAAGLVPALQAQRLQIVDALRRS